MISATTQTLAELLSRELSTIGTEQISFNHPILSHFGYPGLNVYCYHVQTRYTEGSIPAINDVCNESTDESTSSLLDSSPDSGVSQWFDLSFLISVSDYTALGEQYLLSEVFAIVSNYKFLPEEVLAPELQGRGLLPMRVFSNEWSDIVMLWNVLCAPLRPALQVKITVPCIRHPSKICA
jgi:hypothetical protein